MSDERVTRPELTTAEVRAFIDRAPRCKVQIHVLYQPPGVTDTVETHLVNLSRSGMFLASRGKLLDVGVTVEFKFSVDDELVVMQGTAQVVRLSLDGERGMGLRFVDLDAESRRLVDQIVDMNSREPVPVPYEEEDTMRTAVPGQRAVEYGHGTVRITLSSATAGYFTYNPSCTSASAAASSPPTGTCRSARATSSTSSTSRASSCSAARGAWPPSRSAASASGSSTSIVPRC